MVLIAIVSIHAAGSPSLTRAIGPNTPAAFTRMDTTPSSDSTALFTDSIDRGSARSAGTTSVRVPKSANSRCVCFRAPSLLATSATSAPCRASRMAMHCPTPRLAPVTTATLWVRLVSGISQHSRPPGRHLASPLDQSSFPQRIIVEPRSSIANRDVRFSVRRQGAFPMPEAVIVSAVRTPVGRAPKGALSTTRPDDLAALAVGKALERVPQLDKSEIDDVVLGCAQPEGEQGWDIARWTVLRAGLPVEIPGATVNRLCASGLEAIAMADQRIRSGAARMIVAGGAESMSLIPMGGNKPSPNPWLAANYPASLLTMGLTAERVARHYGISREDQDAYALASHQKALAAQAAGRFAEEIIPVKVTT